MCNNCYTYVVQVLPASYIILTYCFDPEWFPGSIYILSGSKGCWTLFQVVPTSMTLVQLETTVQPVPNAYLHLNHL